MLQKVMQKRTDFTIRQFFGQYWLFQSDVEISHPLCYVGSLLGPTFLSISSLNEEIRFTESVILFEPSGHNPDK